MHKANFLAMYITILYIYAKAYTSGVPDEQGIELQEPVPGPAHAAPAPEGQEEAAENLKRRSRRNLARRRHRPSKWSQMGIWRR